MDFKKGDYVRVRTWDDMANEFGLDLVGDIDVRFWFTKRMKFLCGQTFILNSIIGEGPTYLLEDIDSKSILKFSFSIGMLEKIEEADYLQLQDKRKSIFLKANSKEELEEVL